MTRLLLLVSLCATLAACSDDGAPDTDTGDTTTDTGSGDDVDDDTEGSGDTLVSDTDGADAEADGSGDDADTDGTPEFSRTYTEAEEMAAPAGHRWARSIVHLHSTHSHDACDDVPRLEDGSFNIPCLESLRKALCDVRIDVAYLTDHPTHMDEEEFTDLLLYVGDDDELLTDDLDRPYANRMTCSNGHQVLIRVGAEDSLMPIGMHEHVDPDQPTRHEIMNDYTADAATRMHETGGLVWVAHTEGRSADELRPLGIDGLEVYQLHANLDPRIRTEHLGLDAVGPIASLFPMMAGTSEVPPDLALLGFLEQNTPSLETWATLLAEGPMVGTAGTDAHENTFPGEAIDGERLDSYRRMMSWFSNYLLVQGELTPETADAALGAGRVVIAFDLLGDPDGFDIYLDRGVDSAERIEVGSSIGFTAGQSLRGHVPTPVGPSGIEAEVTTIVFRADGAGWQEEARYEAGDFEFAIPSAGVYRVEIRVTGRHFAPWTEDHDWPDREYPWIYTNAWRVGVDDV